MNARQSNLNGVAADFDFRIHLQRTCAAKPQVEGLALRLPGNIRKIDIDAKSLSLIAMTGNGAGIVTAFANHGCGLAASIVTKFYATSRTLPLP